MKKIIKLNQQEVASVAGGNWLGTATTTALNGAALIGAATIFTKLCAPLLAPPPATSLTPTGHTPVAPALTPEILGKAAKVTLLYFLALDTAAVIGSSLDYLTTKKK